MTALGGAVASRRRMAGEQRVWWRLVARERKKKGWRHVCVARGEREAAVAVGEHVCTLA
jgi:hypothetical protein